jgi:hypothetical protein
MDDEGPVDVPRPGEGGAPVAGEEPHDEVSANAQELRRLIDAGASSPEELRALAARIREHRELEESRWRAEVRPALLKSKKRRFIVRDVLDDPKPANGTNTLLLGLALLGGVLVLLLVAAQSSILFLLVPIVGLLVYAYRQGSQAGTGTDPSAEDAAD